MILLGDKRAEAHVWEHDQVDSKVDQIKLREAFGVVDVADCVIGPETAMTNAAGALDTPVITLLSHSSHENLCKYFKHDYCLAPDPKLAPCYGKSGCHLLHYSLESCPQGEIIDERDGEILARGPLCAMGAIRGERIQARLDEVYTLWKEAQSGIIVKNGSKHQMDSGAVEGSGSPRTDGPH